MSQYVPVNKIRIVTAASLFDGHDAAINIMRRILQSKGAEVIHLGHNRSVMEIVEAAIEEDVQGIAITSYQGGHIEFFKYMKDLLDENGCGHIRIVGGGGGTILPDEIRELHDYGIARIYSPDDGRQMGLEGMIDDLLQRCDFRLDKPAVTGKPMTLGEWKDIRSLARAITLAENGNTPAAETATPVVPVIGITGTGGAGKSSVTDELVRRFLAQFPACSLAVISVDPSRKRSGGALLGDRIRMNSIHSPRVYMRSLATRDDNTAISAAMRSAVSLCKQAGYDLVILETAGAGQSDTSIVEHADLSLYVMTPEYGAASQLEKINMLDYADLIAINKFDKNGALDALHDVCKQYKRNHRLFNAQNTELPVFGTVAAQFNDAGVNRLFTKLLTLLQQKTGFGEMAANLPAGNSGTTIIPLNRSRYLAEIVENSCAYEEWVAAQCTVASKWYRLRGVLTDTDNQIKKLLLEKERDLLQQLDPANRQLIDEWPAVCERYKAPFLEYSVRGKTIRQPLRFTTLSGTVLQKMTLPAYSDWGDVLRWCLRENLPGEFPFTAGSFALKRHNEDPTRMFAGEGGPERTNRRFHYLSSDQSAKRLSTAFDSVTLYGESPDRRPDIYGKVGNSGVSIATVDDAKKLYSGFDLCDPLTSVSMTINGPAPIVLAFFLHAAIDQHCEKWLRNEGWQSDHEQGKDDPAYDGDLPEGHNGLGLGLLGQAADQLLSPGQYALLKAEALQQVRGTVQADILKEDQAQNTCIFSTEFALKLMGDVQAYFIEHNIRNFYSISISGYHIAEAGANPVTQLAFTLANGFTYVEYFLSRGMHIDAFAPNLSFFFSNGMDPEYSVIGRVARRIWAKAMKYKYKANERSQKLKYHIQTSGRSLHAQEIDFNDIRTTLQALYAIYDNCNSLHTNAYDEAITTPTEESVRRAMAIQLIINRELGTARTENFIQGSFVIESLTDLVEEAVMQEFERINERGGVLGAMERMYQRNKIQEESLHYETQKHTGELPIIGVNSFLNRKGSPTVLPAEVIRATTAEKDRQIDNLQRFHRRHAKEAPAALERLRQTALHDGNLFAALMETVKYCSLGQITQALYEVGGQYRRNM